MGITYIINIVFGILNSCNNFVKTIVFIWILYKKTNKTTCLKAESSIIRWDVGSKLQLVSTYSTVMVGCDVCQ